MSDQPRDAAIAAHCPCPEHLAASLGLDGCPCAEEDHVHLAALAPADPTANLRAAALAAVAAEDAVRDAINGIGHEGPHDRDVHMDPCTDLPGVAHVYDTTGDCAQCGGAQYGTEDTKNTAMADLRVALGLPLRPFDFPSEEADAFLAAIEEADPVAAFLASPEAAEGLARALLTVHTRGNPAEAGTPRGDFQRNIANEDAAAILAAWRKEREG